MQSFLVKTENFSGPMEKLLELVEERKMDITALNLAEVTTDFLDYTRYLETLPREKGGEISRTIADFVVVAAKLLLVKSKYLLPELPLSKEEEIEIKDLEIRLKIYQEFKISAVSFLSVWNSSNRSFSRELFQNRPPLFFPPEKITILDLLASVKNLSETTFNEIKEENMPRPKAFSIQEKIVELLERIKSVSSVRFRDIIENKKKGEIIALFLAVLHLIRDHFVFVNQGENFSDIEIKEKKKST
ncbi:MAG: hypothetical protein A2430_01445 [Candidatus Liptonbacteria bacterium RIFOXYC1_FULL_36_8]|uniref:Segregation and condensation protein A n=3 Tax=Candidatus Liptoniibacteriota TaxID=1817909 RepID=A0A1G2CNZ6_9BACT|nr:MAG: hypothetical protein A2390_02515 [Candidatus Liptonbacteria bacterium RIFOXYB1_FULL_36_10]OGZ03939.1 MAG: hypothetical protein A2604_03215 [Candidatus Liptonbacteria bacterium RIFOXYD1_FULL_36_11]OGZ04357.1 MAG: hypothetical protein A2430_01445 [Candidatus Liptonbacteria bacterium RIFOXYC1_FULL_36_8]